jgi:hypothetical protein
MLSSTTLLRTFVRAAFLTIAAVVCAALLPVPAPNSTADMGPLAFTIPVPEGRVSLKQVHAAVLRGAIGREWGVKEDTETKVIIYLLHRRNEATVTFLISDKSVEAYCVGYAVDKSGNRKKPEQPEGWLKYLREDITKGINEAAYLQGR